MMHTRSARQRRSRDDRGDRWRGYRARVKVGRRECDGALDFLIRCHWLAEDDAADARAVGCAIGRMLEDAAR